MPDTAIFTELDGQHAELLPARAVMSLLSVMETSMMETSIGGNPGTPGAPGVGIPVSGSDPGLPIGHFQIGSAGSSTHGR